MNEYELLDNLLPETIKEAVASYKETDIATMATGMNDFSFDKVAAYFGGRVAARRNRWRTVTAGLKAIHDLRG